MSFSTMARLPRKARKISDLCQSYSSRELSWPLRDKHTVHDSQADKRDGSIEELALAQVVSLEDVDHSAQIVVANGQVQFHFSLSHFWRFQGLSRRRKWAEKTHFFSFLKDKNALYLEKWTKNEFFLFHWRNGVAILAIQLGTWKL